MSELAHPATPSPGFPEAAAPGDRTATNPIPARRQAFRETVYLVGAVLLALVGQHTLAGGRLDSVALGVPLLAIAAIIAFTIREDELPEAPAVPAPGAAWLSRLKSGPLRDDVVIALVCWLAALAIFGAETGAIRNLAGALYLVAIALGLVVALRLDPREQAPGTTPHERHQRALLGGIVLVAAFFRLWRLDSLPWGLWYDEAAHGLDVIRILGDPSYRPVYLQSIVPEPALHWYFDAAFVALLGPNPLALRLSAMVAGLVAVVAIFLLARRLFGWRVGVVAAALLAVSSWHVDFSRVMFNAIWSDALNLLAAYFLVKALQAGRFRDYALAGLCIGIGLNNYYSTTLFVAAVVLYLLYHCVRPGRPVVRQFVPGLVVLAAFLLLAAGPLLEFAVQHPGVYLERYRQLSVLAEARQAGSVQPIVGNLEKHLAMFNYAGDPNGRHNLSGSPELDQVAGALFIVGLGLALRRARRPAYALVLIWLPVALAGGILSVDFEAPQSLRSLDAVIGATVLAALPVGAVWRRLAWARIGRLSLPGALGGAAPLSVGAVLAFVLFAGSATLGYQKYFVHQATNFRSWSEYDPAQTEIGREIAALNLQTTDVYLGAVFLNEPTIQFFAPNYRQVPFDPAEDLPFRGSHAAVVFLPDTQEADALTIQHLYPRAQIRAFGPPFGGPPILYIITVPADQITQSQGIVASYAPTTGNATPTILKAPDLNLTWSKPPAPLSFPFTATLRGTLTAPRYGTYRFQFQGLSGSEVYLDENPLLKGPGEKTVVLAEGMHVLRIVATVSAPSSARLLWQPPDASALTPIPGEDLFTPAIASRGLLGIYYPNANWQGPPANEVIDRAFDLHFQITPLPRPYSVDWSGKIDIPRAGLYVFGVQARDVASILIDDKPVATNPPNQYAQGALPLAEGLHDVRIRYQDLSGYSYVTVSWQPPGLPREVLPATRLFPPQGAYPDRAGPLQPDTLKLTSGPAPSAAAPAAPAAQPAKPVAAQIGTLPTAPYVVVKTIGGPGNADGQFKSPRGVAIDADGNVYVVDADLQRVSVFGPDGQFLRAWGGPGDGPAQFTEPVDIAVDSTGNVVVLDSTTSWLKVFTPDGKPVRQIGGPALGAYHPRGLAIDASGRVFIANAGGANVIELGADGSPIARLGERGADAGQIAEPVGVAVASDGTIFVTDTANSRLSQFDPSFTYIQGWAIPKSASVVGPHVAVLPDRSILIT
ncbi:MAG TPA: glycosyltransferase family 39 protein, partial [Chloroflexota bacterium]|nr:glycosyltransferase family 39 protein [Chloroflexota bacterium]